jgi:hypothetical protein
VDLLVGEEGEGGCGGEGEFEEADRGAVAGYQGRPEEELAGEDLVVWLEGVERRKGVVGWEGEL